MKKTYKAWKTLKNKTESEYGNHKWKLNKWYSISGKLEMCSNGFHASKHIQDAMNYVSPGYVCEVEYGGEVIEEANKFVASEMRITKKYKWGKKDSVRLALFCVKRVIKSVDRDKFPGVFNFCVNSIKAIENYLNHPCKKTVSVAWSLALSDAESFAEFVARSAARTVAEFAAWSVAKFGARSAVEFAVESAVLSAIGSGELFDEKKIVHKWIKRYLNNRKKGDKK